MADPMVVEPAVEPMAVDEQPPVAPAAVDEVDAAGVDADEEPPVAAAGVATPPQAAEQPNPMAIIAGLVTSLSDSTALARQLKIDFDHSEKLRRQANGRLGVEVKKSTEPLHATIELQRQLIVEKDAELRKEQDDHNVTRGALTAREQDLNEFGKREREFEQKYNDASKEIERMKKLQKGDPAAAKTTVLAYVRAVATGAEACDKVFTFKALVKKIADFTKDTAAVKPETPKQLSGLMKALKFTADTAGLQVVRTKSGKATNKRSFDLPLLRIHLQQFA